jgi:diamine N-acetyltransferase
MIEIIPANSNDIPIIQDIAYRTWPVTFAGILSPDQISFMLEKMYSADALKYQMEVKSIRFLLAKDELEGTIGFLSLETSFEGLSMTKIHKLYILPEAQNKGVGRALINRAAQIAKNKENHLLQLNVNKYNSTAINFYKHIGFLEAGAEEITIGNGYVMDDLILEMKI